MNQILQSQPMTIFGDGTQTRAFSYIADVAPLMADAMTTPGARNEVFNVGADHPSSLNELAAAVAGAMDVAPHVVHLPERLEVRHAYAAHDKLRRVFGERPETPLNAGLDEMAAWVRSHGARQSARLREVEIARNLPASWQAG